MLPTTLITGVILSFLIGNLHAQSAVSEGIKIVGPLSEGKFLPPPPKPELPAFNALRTLTRQMNVVEAPEMAGLPPVKGRITVTVQLVEDPHLPDPPPPLPALPPSVPAVQARLAELREQHQSTELVFVSATVYSHSRTLLNCYPTGRLEKMISAWSNLDFNCFSGFTTYQVTQFDGTSHQYGLIIGIGNDDTARRREILLKNGKTDLAAQIPQIPNLPDLATAGPSFVITKGDNSDAASMKIIQSLHDLYQAEGPRMEKAYQARIKANEERRAYLLAHPPAPKNVAIQFWRRERPLESNVEINASEGDAQ